MRSLLFFLLLSPLFLFGQQDSLAQKDQVVRQRNTAAHVVWRNNGRKINGLSITGFSATAMMPRPSRYRVNGLELALYGEEHVLNGLEFSLLGFGVDSLNGLAVGLFGGGAWDMNGVMLTGLVEMSASSMNGLSIAGLSQVNNRGNGITISGLTNVYDSTYNGLCIASVYQRNHYLFRGISLTGTTQLFDDAKGISLCGAVTATGQNFYGFQFSGVCSYTGEKFCGVGIAAVVNRVGGEAHGVLISAVNSTPVMQGVQIGVINCANRLQGVQFGLINYNRANPKWCRVMPLVNFNFRSLQETDTIRNGDSCYVLKSYNRNGKIAGVSHYCNGKLNGKFTLYNQFDDKARETNYVDGRKDGEEFFFDGAGRITESNYWQADSLVWSSAYEYTGYNDRESYEKTITYADLRTEKLVFSAGDTLYRTTDNHFRVERVSEETSELFYKVFHYDTLVELIWVVEEYNWIGYDVPKKVFTRHITPASIPQEGLIFQVAETESDAMLQYLADDLSKALRRLTGHPVPVTFEYKKHGKVRERFSFNGPLVENLFYDERRYPGFSKYDRKGRLRLQRSPAGTTAWYRSGKPRVEFLGDSTVVRKDGYYYPMSMTRVSYYKDGTKAAYISPDSGFAWSKKGAVIQQEVRLHSKRWYRNGQLQYEVAGDSLLRYYSKRGTLLAEGRGDTVWLYAKNGNVSAKYVFEGYRSSVDRHRPGDSLQPARAGIDAYTVRITHYAGGRISDTTSQDDYTFFHGEGKRLERILLDEPGPRMNRYWEPEENRSSPAYLDWFGMQWLDACSDIVACRGAIESPVSPPRRMKRYYPDWEVR